MLRFIQFGDRISHAKILSFSDGHGRDHCLLLTIDPGDRVAVKSGFASGYLGEGPEGFSKVLQALELHGAEIDEVEVSHDLIERVDSSSLTVGDLDKIDGSRPVRPTRWYGYLKDGKRPLRDDFPAVMPFAITDNRITDLALKFFADPDDTLLKGYRRLEDTVRRRSGLDEHGAKLFSAAFQPDKGPLMWKGLSNAEHAGRCQMFAAAYMAYRNPRAHRELEYNLHRQLTEFLALNHLFILEAESCERS